MSTHSRPGLLTVIETTPWIADLLAASGTNFDVARKEYGFGEPMYLVSRARLEMIASDASGDAFFLARGRP